METTNGRMLRSQGNIVHTEASLAELPMADLLMEFNANICASGPLAKPITKFADKKSALRRTWASMESIGTKTVSEIEADLDIRVAAAQAAVAPQLTYPPAEIIIDEEGTDAVEAIAKEVAGTPVTPPVTPATDPMVFCDKCGRSVPKSSVFTLPSSGGGVKSYCKKEEGCKKSKGSKISLKEQAQAITAQVAIKKAPKAPKTPKGPNPNIGKFDNCLLSAKENKRANSESIRSAVYNHIASNQGCTIKDMEADGVALLPVLRDCVKKLFADLKIDIQGWEVVTPRTLNFREVK